MTDAKHQYTPAPAVQLEDDTFDHSKYGWWDTLNTFTAILADFAIVACAIRYLIG